MEYIFTALFDIAAIVLALMCLRLALKKSENTSFSLKVLIGWLLPTILLCLFVSPFFVLLPLIPYIPIVVVAQFRKMPSTGMYIAIAEMGAVSVLFLMFAYVVYWLNSLYFTF